jgi:hypothetical protein
MLSLLFYCCAVLLLIGCRPDWQKYYLLIVVMSLCCGLIAWLINLPRIREAQLAGRVHCVLSVSVPEVCAGVC